MEDGRQNAKRLENTVGRLAHRNLKQLAAAVKMENRADKGNTASASFPSSFSSPTPSSSSSPSEVELYILCPEKHVVVVPMHLPLGCNHFICRVTHKSTGTWLEFCPACSRVATKAGGCPKHGEMQGERLKRAIMKHVENEIKALVPGGTRDEPIHVEK